VEKYVGLADYGFHEMMTYLINKWKRIMLASPAPFQKGQSTPWNTSLMHKAEHHQAIWWYCLANNSF
jgi:hypothetical protein